MKLHWLSFIVISLLSCLIACQQSQTNLTHQDSVDIKEYVERYKDSVRQAGLIGHIPDSTELSDAPIVVTKATVVDQEYSSYRDIKVSFRNVSDKTVDGIKFKFYGETVFGKPADMGNPLVDGISYGNMDVRIKPGKNMTLKWNINSRDAKKNIKAWPVEVVFSDGTKWEFKD